MQVEPHWTVYVSALLTPVVAVLGVYIACRQASIARNKLRLDLFERRFSVYHAARSLLAEVMTKGKISDEALYKFGANTREARWLLNEKVHDYLQNEIWSKATELMMYDAELESLPVGEERSKFVQKRADLRGWFFDQYPVLDAKFDHFLKLEH